MDKIFKVYLSKGKYPCEAHAWLDLPARPWAMLDALDKVRLQEGDTLAVSVEDYQDYEELAPYLPGRSLNLMELNALAERLACFDQVQRAAFTGLLQMEEDKKDGPISLQALRDMAESTDCCHVVGEALDVGQLGRFYAENGFVPEAENLPDGTFELLDFALIGIRARRAEGGVFTQQGYVVQHSDLKEAPAVPDHVEQPEYMFRLSAWKFSQANEQPGKVIQMDLPATQEQIDHALQEIGAASWGNVIYEVEDSAIPNLPTEANCLHNISQMNDLAVKVQQLLESGKFPKYKAVLEAYPCEDIGSAMRQADLLDAYIFKPHITSYAELFTEELSTAMGEAIAQQLLPYMNRDMYGRIISDSRNSVQTAYGGLTCGDGQPIQKMEDQAQMNGMEMR